MNFFVLVIFSLSPVTPSLSPLSLSVCLSFSLSLPLLSLYLSLSHPCLSFHLSLSHPCRLPLILPLMSPCLSFSHPCLSFSLSVAVSPSSTPCLSSYLPLSHHAPLFFYGSLSYPRLSLSPAPIFLSLSNPGLSSYLCLSPAPISLFIFLSLSNTCLCLFRCLSLYPTPVSSLSLSLFVQSLFLSLPLLSLFPSFFSPIPALFLSFSHSCFPFYLCLTPVSPSPSMWFSLSLSLPHLSLFVCGGSSSLLTTELVA